MKRVMASVLVVLSVSAFGSKVSANDFKSAVITSTNTLPTVSVSDNQFLTIRTFTQQGSSATERGLVTITMLNGLPASMNILSASIVPADTTAIEPVNTIVIAGPAMVSVTCPDAAATCFITYRKESN